MKKALIIIDIQNDYFKDGKMALEGSDDACKNARYVLDKFRADDLPVIHIQHVAARPEATFFLPGTNGAEIHETVKPLRTEKVITKHYPNSFRDTELLEYLKEKQITDLIICGMMTHVCVDSTTRAAKDFGFNITLIGDACATKDLEINGDVVKASEIQKSFFAALNYFYSSVMSTEEYLSI
jgi:nicotinamidase-related amidase